MSHAADPCPVALAHSLEALRAESRALQPVLDDVGPDAWGGPTRLEAWNVAQLTAHLVRGVGRITTYLAAPVPPEPACSWLGYWRAVVEAGDAGAVAARSIQEAARTPPADLPRRFRDACRTALVEAEPFPASRVVTSPFGPIRLDHYLTTRLVEVVVHGLDLRHALGLEEVATPAGLEVATAVLDGLLGVPRPVDLERDDVRFALAATGRIPHDDPDLPVLS